MKRFSSQMNRIGCAAVCVSLSLALGCGCAVLPPASSKPASSASVPTDSSGKPLYDASRLDDGQLRALYGYDRAGSSTAILCGSKVLYQSAGCRHRRDELLVPQLVGPHRPGRTPQRPLR